MSEDTKISKEKGEQIIKDFVEADISDAKVGGDKTSAGNISTDKIGGAKTGAGPISTDKIGGDKVANRIKANAKAKLAKTAAAGSPPDTTSPGV